MSAPPDSTEPTRLSRAMLYLAYAGMIALLGGGAMFFGAWLYRGYDTALGWPSMASSMGFLAVSALIRAAGSNQGWPRALLAFLETGTVTVLLIVNVVAATVVLWALNPSLATGLNGWVAAFLIGVILTLPVILGAAKLVERRLESALSWKDWFRIEIFRHKFGFRVLLAVAGFFVARLSAMMLEDWLRAGYPVAIDYVYSVAGSTGIMVALTLISTSRFDMRSMMRSLLAALVVFATAIASATAVAVVAVTLRSDSLLLMMMDILPVSVVLVGAVLLVAHRPGGQWDEAPDTAREEEAPS